VFDADVALRLPKRIPNSTLTKQYASNACLH